MMSNYLTGQQLNQICIDKEFYIILNKEIINFDYEYKNGLNIHTKFNKNYSLCKGLKFVNKNNVPQFLCEDTKYLCKIVIPNDAIIFIENYDEDDEDDEDEDNILFNFKTNKLILNFKDLFLIEDFYGWNNYEYCKLAVLQNYYALQFVKEQTEEICKLAILQDYYSLQYVKEQTEEICKLAVTKNWYALVFVKEQN
jgi:hypothetical protein